MSRRDGRVFSREQLAAAAKRVRVWRAEHGVSQREFAEQAGLSTNAFQAFEAGERNTRPDTLDKVAGVLKISVPVLVAPRQRAFTYDARVATFTPATIDFAEEYQIADTATKVAVDKLLLAHKAK